MVKPKSRKPFYKKPEWYTPIIIGILLTIFFGGKYYFKNIQIGKNNQQNSGGINYQAGGDILIINAVNSTSICPKCPESTTFSEFGLINHFTFTITKNGAPTKINTNFYNIKLTLPTGQEVFFDKFLHDESIIFGLCSDDKSNCYIFPDYRFDKKKNNVCVDAYLDKTWGASGFTIKETKNRAACVQDADNNKFLSECNAV